MGIAVQVGSTFTKDMLQAQLQIEEQHYFLEH